MQTLVQNPLLKRLALAPAALALIMGFSAPMMMAGSALAADNANSADVHARLVAAEATVLQAIARRDSSALHKTVAGLSPLIEAGLKRKKAGGKVSSCDMAALSLGFSVTSLSQAITQTGEPRKLLMGDARQAAQDFSKDMTACDVQAGQKIGNHAGVEQALRAL